MISFGSDSGFIASASLKENFSSAYASNAPASSFSKDRQGFSGVKTDLEQSQSVQDSDGASSTSTEKNAAGEPLSESEKKQVEELKKRDQEVRQHEQAHAIVGGPYASAPSYQFITGPDGKRYATSGEVKIDTSREKTPEETIRKMDVVIRAALAPAQPSAQDRAVARQAQQTRLEAQRELSEQRNKDVQGDDEIDGAEAVASLNSAKNESDPMQNEDGAAQNLSVLNALSAYRKVESLVATIAA